MRRTGLIAAIFASSLARLALAQVQLSGEIGSAALRQVGLPESGVLTFGTDLRLSSSRASLASSALGAVASDGGATGQAVVTGALFAPPRDGPRWQIFATASTFGLTGDLPVVGIQGVAREYFGDALRGVFVGAGGGGVARGGLWRPAVLGQAGGWTRIDDHQLIAAATFTSTRSEIDYQAAGFEEVRVTSPATYADLTAGWQRERGAMTLAVTAGARAGVRGVPALDAWGAATATAYVAPRLALVGSVGRALEDIVRGLPEARYASIALRMTLQPHPNLWQRAPPLPAGPRLTVSPAGAARRIEVQVSAVSSVEIMADFTQWSPVLLTRDGTAWRIDRAIESGPHRVAIRIDGGEWLAPANLPRVSNGFGGMVGLITIP